ncbi:MAG: DUF309 domain-containing protein [Anaerolineales bacterium]|nr:DUF309 domain-containing protein [Anaerolineales bacterium]
MADLPVIVAFISDLFFSVQVENIAQALGYRVRRVERWNDIEPGDVAQTGQPHAVLPTAPLVGQTAVLVTRLLEWQPVLVIVDLSSTTLPWADWVAAIKAGAATRRIPVLGFGPHTDLALREHALDVGCDAVVARSRLVSGLGELIAQYGRKLDDAALAADCAGPLSPLAARGIQLFNARQYFEAHEELEHAWNADPGPGRELYRGVLQVAVAYLHVTRGNYRGALKMFLRLRQWLDPMPAVCRGVDVAQLRQDALAIRAALEALGPERIGEFDQALLMPVRFIELAQGTQRNEQPPRRLK